MSDTKGPFSVAKAEDSSGFLLWQVMSFWQRGISRELAPLGLSHAQFVLLAGLVDRTVLPEPAQAETSAWRQAALPLLGIALAAALERLLPSG